MPGELVISGATGLVGRALCELLAARPDATVVALVRRAGTRLPAGVTERVFDYEDLASYARLAATAPRALFCCLGTTRAKAGPDTRTIPTAPRPEAVAIAAMGVDAKELRT